MAGKEKPEDRRSTGRSAISSKSPGRKKSSTRNVSPGRSKGLSTSKKSPERTQRQTRTKSPINPQHEGRRKSPARPKSPGRPKSSGRSKSTGRSASPPARRQSLGRSSPSQTKVDTKTRPVTPNRTKGRSPIRGRLSPATSTPYQTLSRRSPLKRSVERLTKDVGSEKIKVVESRTKKHTIVLDTDSDSDPVELVPEVPEKPKATVRGRTRKIDSEFEKDDTGLTKENYEGQVSTIGLVQRYMRSSQNREVDRVVHLKHFENLTVTKRLGEFSDEDELQEKKLSEVRELKRNLLTEFGGTIGALFLIFAIPLSLVGLHTICNETLCSFHNTPSYKRFTTLSQLFDAKSFLGVIALTLTLALFSALPFGGRKVSALPSKQGKFVYVMNGFLGFVLVSLSGLALEYYGVKITKYIVDHTFHLLISSISLGLIISVYSYIRSFYVPVSALNSYAVGRNGLYAFVVGHELNPRIFNIVDLKLLLFRACTIYSILLDFAYLYNSITIEWPEDSDSAFLNLKLNLSPTLLVYICLHTIYQLDTLVFESTFITTFTSQEEGFGYFITMLLCVLPFANVLPIKYILDHNVNLASWKLISITAVFLFGYLLYRGSNNQKDAFRKNPYSPSLSHLEAIPTTQGKKLLVSGFWGVVRHPNYLGDLIMQLCWIPFLLWSPPVLKVLFTIVFLIHRATRDNARCKKKYGSAWDRYCGKVKHILIPKVY